MAAQSIKIVGARQHNLKNLSLEIPREKLVVITGLSGSGKSSLAFDTLYAEGQRKYVESLSAYARQFLDQMQKPDVDFIEGLSPAIAIEQRSASGSPRSTIATTTEIYDYLRVLFSAVGQPHDPATGAPISRQTPQQIVDRILAYPAETRIVILAPIVRGQVGEFRDVIEKIKREGFVRARIDGEIVELSRQQPIRLEKTKAHDIEVVVDRLVIREGIRARLADSVDTALKWGGSKLVVLRNGGTAGAQGSGALAAGGAVSPGASGTLASRLPTGETPVLQPPPAPLAVEWEELKYSTDYCNPETDFTMPELTPKHFSFNSHLGACAACQGLGTELVCDADLMIDREKTLAEGAVRPWSRGSKRMVQYYGGLLHSLARAFRVPLDVPFDELPDAFKDALCFGTGDRAIEITWGKDAKQTKAVKPFEGLVPQMQRLYEQTESEFTRNRIRAFMSRRMCSACNGARLRPEILAVTVESNSGLRIADRGLKAEAGSDASSSVPAAGDPAGSGAVAENPKSAIRNPQSLSIQQFCQLTITAARHFIANLALSEQQKFIVAEVTREILARLNFLVEVGLGYLTLDRESGTLSGGEAQRIRLATQIGSGLAGVLYVLDEPSIGLHQRDNERLIGTLRRLRDLGNSVIVVEHDEDTIRAADHIIDLGPGAGARGGHLVAQGTIDDILAHQTSLTAQYLSHTLRISVPKRRVAPRRERPDAIQIENPKSKIQNSEGWLTVAGASENNLKNIDVAFPLGCLTCVTGVSGSGKSTLIDDILRRVLFRLLYRSKDRPGKHRALLGADQIDKAIVIDQSPIGRTPRSNPVTYTGAFAPIRQLFSQLPASRVRGYDSGRFSFNVKGGRCENCQGDGSIKIEMHFLADVFVECEVCGGKRYNRETLEITYKGKNIADVLDMTVDEASRFFRNVPTISDRLIALEDVGLGYVRLGQAATTLSGGEAQRVKLAAELAKKATGRTVYILDEPTTGLHFADIHKLLEVLMKLRDAGNTLIVIEHNLEVIKCADWIVDLGPEGGEGGGRIVGEGTPETIANLDESHTGRYLKRML
jgi:excinuclease ABC subunit A